MFKRIKSWFQKIVADEAKRAIAPLESEAHKVISVLKDDVEGRVIEVFNSEHKQLEAHVALVKDELQKAFADLKNKLRSVDGVLQSEPYHWKASPEQVAADHALKVVK